MPEMDRDKLAEWLAAEQDEASDRADLLFAMLAAARLPPLAPPTGLADRIVVALPPSRARAWWKVPDLSAASWVRAAAAAAVVVLGVSIPLVSVHDVIELAGACTAGGARLLHALVVATVAAAGVWGASLDLLSSLGRAAGAVATTGSGPALIAANLFLSAAAFAGLKRLLPPREECL
jgi:hypothetical protein